MNANDISEFKQYLRNCTDRQVQEVCEKEREGAERDPEREIYYELAKCERDRRGIWTDD